MEKKNPKWNGREQHMIKTRVFRLCFPTHQHNKNVFCCFWCILLLSTPGSSQFQFITTLAMTDFISRSLYVLSSSSAWSFSRCLKVLRHFSELWCLKRRIVVKKKLRPLLEEDERIQFLVSIERSGTRLLFWLCSVYFAHGKAKKQKYLATITTVLFTKLVSNILLRLCSKCQAKWTFLVLRAPL